MSERIFLELFDRGRAAIPVILAVLLLRFLLKRAPKIFSYALWSIVLVRLLLPVTFESPAALLERTEPAAASYALLGEDLGPIDAASAALGAIGDTINGGIGPQRIPTADFEADGTRRIIVTDIGNVALLLLRYLWLAGMTAMLVCGVIALIRLKRRIGSAVCLWEGVYESDAIDSPFVLGLIRPRIYLPAGPLDDEREFILLHEKQHIRRGDPIFRLIAWLTLCLYCFHPLVWLAFYLSGRDMEMSCDEAVLRRAGPRIRAAYSASLIRLSTGRRMPSCAPLAFGEGDTLPRIQNIAKWKKPAVWVIALSLLLCLGAAVCLIGVRSASDGRLWGADYRVAEVLYRVPDADISPDNDTPRFCITADLGLWERGEDGKFALLGRMLPYTLDKAELDSYTEYADGWRRKYETGGITDSYILHLEESDEMYIACRARNGDILLGFGLEDIGERHQEYSDDSFLYWLCRLESTFGGTHLTGEYHERSLAGTVGGDVEIFHTHFDGNHRGFMITAFRAYDTPYRDGVTVPAPGESALGFAVFSYNKDESGYRLIACHTYPEAAGAENGIFVCPDPAVMNRTGERDPAKTFEVMLIANKAIVRAERILTLADGSEKTWTASHLSGHEMLLWPWDTEADALQVKTVFYDADDRAVAEIGREARTVMVPDTSGMEGAFGSYLWVPIDGEVYRYERTVAAGESVKTGALLTTFTESEGASSRRWSIWALADTPDYSTVLAEAGEDYRYLYTHSPARASDPAALKKARADGAVILEDGDLTSGADAWETFLARCDAGTDAEIALVHWHTLDPDTCSEEYYRAMRKDYPSMTEIRLTYNKDGYTLILSGADGQTHRRYRYLSVFHQKTASGGIITRWVLVHDKNLTWADIEHGMFSSQFGDYIDHFTVCSDKK